MHPSMGTHNGFCVIEGRNLSTVYDKAIRTVWTQGRQVVDQRGNKTREIRNLVTYITTDVIDYPSFGPTSAKYGEDFANGLIKDALALDKAEQFDYSYGERIRESNALNNVIDILCNNPESRTCVLPIYMPKDTETALRRSKNIRDNGPMEVPCMTQIMFLVRDGQLHATMTMRSNDIVGAYPADMYGVRKLQEVVAKQIRAKMGTTTHIAASAHIIEANDADFVERHMRTPRVF